MREFHGTPEEALLLIRCNLALSREGIGPAGTLGTIDPPWDDLADGEILTAAARMVWQRFSTHDLEEMGLDGLIPSGAVWDDESYSWRV